MPKKIYFAGSITGGRGDKELYIQLIQHLKTYGDVLTEHVGDKNLSNMGEDGPTETFIYDRDIEWLKASDVVVAEVTVPSFGVGYEIAKAEEFGKSILCLYRSQPGKKLSAMIRGSIKVKVKDYESLDDAKNQIDKFLTN